MFFFSDAKLAFEMPKNVLRITEINKLFILEIWDKNLQDIFRMNDEARF